MKIKNDKLATLKEWLCRNEKGTFRIQKMYKPLTKGQLIRQQKYSFDNEL
jgi:hypothetical protein